MRNKRIRRHLTVFLLDYLWVILLFLAAPVSLMVCYLTVINKTLGDAWYYYIFLCLFILLCFLLYRLYATWDLYEIFCKEDKTMENFQISDPKGREEFHYQQLTAEMYQLYLNRLSCMEDAHKQNKIMIYRWIHQLKTPLSVIGLISEENKFDSDFKKVAQAAAQIQYDLDQILNMYKLDAIKNDFHAEQVNLRYVSKKCINELKSTFITKGIFPKLEIADNLWVYSDSKWLHFVLYQLLTNAIKYSDKGKQITVWAKDTNGSTILKIQDEGCGIAPSDIGRIFDLFFTGQNGRLRGASSGLGLYMVKQILDYLGHSIEVDSELGTGTKFIISFRGKNELGKSEETILHKTE